MVLLCFVKANKIQSPAYFRGETSTSNCSELKLNSTKNSLSLLGVNNKTECYNADINFNLGQHLVQLKWERFLAIGFLADARL